MPILCADGGAVGAPRLLALGAFDATGEGEDPLSLKPHALQFHAVSEDLKHALRECIERIDNEAIRHLREVSKERVYDRPDAALTEQLSLEALRYIHLLATAGASHRTLQAEPCHAVPDCLGFTEIHPMAARPPNPSNTR